jgi:divalent metal cation (Fe/Co/Zn/Cd) transporter
MKARYPIRQAIIVAAFGYFFLGLSQLFVGITGTSTAVIWDGMGWIHAAIWAVIAATPEGKKS